MTKTPTLGLLGAEGVPTLEDAERLGAAARRVWDLMRDGEWHGYTWRGRTERGEERR